MTECGLCCNRYCDSAGTDRFVAACSGYTREPQPMTNADRIRAMSDEELAEWIASVSTVCECCAHLNDCTSECGYIKTVAGVTAWLKQPAEEEKVMGVAGFALGIGKPIGPEELAAGSLAKISAEFFMLMNRDAKEAEIYRNSIVQCVNDGKSPVWDIKKTEDALADIMALLTSTEEVDDG